MNSRFVNRRLCPKCLGLVSLIHKCKRCKVYVCSRCINSDGLCVDCEVKDNESGHLD